ncbi:hypothetical protein [Pseudoblastomonas halimionae]|uniref:Uncharacterized protein n=1 Tax=Alteriqipengyuania halimionae TaxID=1926630 RepID=A0A6I4U3M7_9SPHN|nr:hypothetical protein [Alteriqipengyuania halimionae]MXP08827.1 hypothetical protein [Alteriqipengyuania halimionae]
MSARWASRARVINATLPTHHRASGTGCAQQQATALFSLRLQRGELVNEDVGYEQI